MLPFSFRRVANLSKSARLKDRLLEDARLQQMSAIGSNIQQHQCQQPPQCQLTPQLLPPVTATPFTPPSLLLPYPSSPLPLPSPSPPLPLPSPSPPPPPLPLPSPSPPLPMPPSPPLSTDGLEILESSQTFVCPFKYHPVDNQWQRMTCENMGLIYVQSNNITPGGLQVSLTAPASIRSIRGDGNCFFRSLSYIITGSERQHASVRLAIPRHMRAFGHLLHLHHNLIENVNDYIKDGSKLYMGNTSRDLCTDTSTWDLPLCL